MGGAPRRASQAERTQFPIVETFRSWERAGPYQLASAEEPLRTVSKLLLAISSFFPLVLLFFRSFSLEEVARCRRVVIVKKDRSGAQVIARYHKSWYL